jgi:hypothetical protein
MPRNSAQISGSGQFRGYGTSGDQGGSNNHSGGNKKTSLAQQGHGNKKVHFNPLQKRTAFSITTDCRSETFIT